MTTSTSARCRRVAFALAGVGMLAGSLMTAGGSSVSAGRTTEPAKTPGAGEVTADVKAIAEQYGWDVGSTASHMADQAGFGVLIDAAAQKFPKNFASASFAEKPGASSQIAVVGAAPRDLVQMVEQSGLDVEIVDGMKYTALQQDARADEIVKVLAEQGHEDAAAAVMADGTIQVSVSGKTDAGVKLPRHLSDGVQIARAPGAVSTDEIVRGGQQMLGGGQCTSGFSVRRISTGERGISTAAHCTPMTQIRVPGAVPTTFRNQHNSTFGDVAWYSTPDLEVDDFVAGPGPGVIRDVAVVWPANGYANNMITCVYSRMQSQRSCDRIYSTNVSARGAGNLIAMDNDNTVGGDSGGPWSFNRIADGIHKGDKWIWFGTRNVFSKADLLPAALGVEVMS